MVLWSLPGGGGAPVYAQKLLRLKGITKSMATKAEYERHRRRLVRRQKTDKESMSLPGWQPQA